MTDAWQFGPHSIISSGWEIWRGKQKVAEVGDRRDAHLIAAAPDMLELLIHLRDFGLVGRCTVKKIEALIVKATRGTPGNSTR